MNKILLLILLILAIALIFTYIRREHFESKPNTMTMKIEVPEMYPISVEHTYDNIDNLIENDTIRSINEITEAAIQKVNKNNQMILFNSALRQAKPLKLSQEESDDYGRFLVNVLNDVSPYKYYTYNKTINISKDMMEHQTRINFHLDVYYNSRITNDKIPLRFNVVVLTEELYEDDNAFKGGDKDIRTYLDVFKLTGLPNNGYLPGTVQK